MSGSNPDVSVVISTYNRCSLLPLALESLLQQKTPGFSYEVVVVDNNSTDDTRGIIQSFEERSDGKLRYLFEAKQGLSHGWNAGVDASRAPIIAFTDDDLIMPADWVANIKRAFDQHPEVAFIGGRVLPVWPHEPPRWLSRALWAPLALQDADQEFYTDEQCPVCLLNKCFRREAFDAVGKFRPDLGRIKDGIGSLEDDELQRRLWKSGRRGLHIPSVIVHSPVAAGRMTKKYYRSWHTGRGRHIAMMRESEFETSRGHLFDVPFHLYRQAIADCLCWSLYLLSADTARAFERELNLRFFKGFYKQRLCEFRAQQGPAGGMLREFARVARSLLSKAAEGHNSGGIS
jgi:glycosyltransferase involved in cell wall biosynthesis